MNCEHPLPVRFQNSQVVVLYHFITSSTTTWNILRGGVSSRKYSTSVTKTKAADYGHKSKWKEDLVPNSCYKAVRLRFSDPMIQPEPEGSTQGYPLVSVEVLRFEGYLKMYLKDLYDRMGRMEINQDVIERMEYRQSYHWDRYQGVFEHMAEVYSVPLQGAYNPPGYAQPQYNHYY
ncbi:hypothetical protein Tco_0105419 [Tanacetum coccineum]